MKFKLLLLSITVNSVIFCNAQNAGNTLNFDGTDAYCTSILPTVFNSISTNDFTVECWVKTETSSVTKRVFFAQKDANNFCTILVNSANVPYFFLRDNVTTYSVNSQVSLTTNQWNHLAFTWDASTNTILSFINGIQVIGISGGSSSFGIDNSMAIGGRTDGQQVFKGSIDELRIWNDIRTPCEIYAGMNSNFTISQPNLVAAYSFNQGVANGTNTSVTTLNDLNNTYNAILTNFELNGSSSNWISSDLLISQSNNNSETRINLDLVTVCDSYTWSDGNTYSSTNNTASYTNTTNGCECVNNLDLTVNYTTTGTDVIAACEAYTWIDNVTYTSSNNSATFVLTNTMGCDSIVTLDLVINLVEESIDVISACSSYTWIDGNTYTSSNNTAIYTIVGGSEFGCDSTITLNLTINEPVTGIDMLTECASYTWIDGNTYTSSNNTATHIIIGGSVHGCDSTVALDLIIESFPDVTILDSGMNLTVAQPDAIYQWLDCDNAFEPIEGENNQVFTPQANGNYAVFVENGICSATSECVSIEINSSVISENLNNDFVMLFPNPTRGDITIQLKDAQNSIVEIFNSLGAKVNEHFIEDQINTITINGEAGVYFIKIKTEYNTNTFYILKQ